MKLPKLEKLLRDVEGIQELEEHELYMPEKENFWNRIKDSYRNYLPKNPCELVSAMTSPSGYYVWKMPISAHKRLNKLLSYSTNLLVRREAEEPALATGIAYGLSSIVYGIKKKSGKHTAAGIFHTLHHLEQHPNEKLSIFAKNSKKIFEKHFGKN